MASSEGNIEIEALVSRDSHTDSTADAIYSVIFLMALDGRSVRQAIKDTALSRSGFYRWRRQNPDEYLAIEEQARVEAGRVRQELALRVASQRLFAQQNLELTMVEAMSGIVATVLEIAREAESDAVKLSAAKTIRDWIRDGTLVHRSVTEDAELQKVKAPLPKFNPHEDSLLGRLGLPPGSKVEITTPEPALEQA